MAEEMQKITGKMQEILLDEGSRRESYRERIKRFPNVMEESFEKTKDVWSSLSKKVENSLSNDISFGLEDEIRQKNVLVYILWQMNDKFSAEKLANEVREKKPDNLVALTNLAFIHLYNGNIPERALHISPDDRYVLEKSAYHYIRSNQLEQGRELFEKAIEIKATSYSHHWLGSLYLRMDTPEYTYVPMNKQFSKETNVFAKVLKHVRSIPHRERNELINKAEYHFQQALELSHECSVTLFDIILLYISLKEYDNARKYCERFKADNKMQDVNFNILFGRLCFKEADGKNDEEEKDQLRRSGMDRFVLALKSAVEFLPFNKDLIEIWEIKEIILDLYEYGNGNTEYKKFVLEFIHSVEDLANDKAFQNILHKSEL
ncbi:interferon-induced protein with tetratricopeptide repeats 1B-like [Octopus vulgaris]|uniref:Interferon-induced protein with tetratricopeptide repeats 1B-like n=1 Tax=Octopus vulgaris TaxID=6645 RepID=A0AA36BQ78_OCTVU|nr:interferon-induced protein with tetratricopeptide repeats 1B-like [Octopus vulgaris]